MSRIDLFICLFLVLTVPASAADPDDVYQEQIKPLLKARCYSCHGALKQEAGLRLDTAAFIRQGGDSGPSVLPGDTSSSLILERVSSEDDAFRMPPEGEKVAAAEIQAIERWIRSGAHAPAAELAEEDPREHWSFQIPQRPELPPVRESQEFHNPIDLFLAERHEEHGLKPLDPAAKPIVLRRLYLDLVGLPPTPQELEAFLKDKSPGAYERVVDRLLDSKRYGERWGRHWMDVWRYSDWYGRRRVPDVWNSAPQIWRWRDWIVESLNEDRGYDRMLREMLAADEIVPEDDTAGYATGYLVRNWYALNPNDWMRNTVEHTGKAFLGLTFNCAHCHDHKYDPISQVDYFRLRAFFEPIYVRQDRVPGEADPGAFQDYEYSSLRKIQRIGAVRVYDKHIDAPTWFYSGGDERNREKERGSILPGLPRFLSPEELNIEPVALPASAWYPGLRASIQQTVIDDAVSALEKADVELASALQSEGPPVEARQRLARARAELDRASAGSGALAGQQSLLLDATSGRRILNNHLDDLKQLPEGAVIQFQVKLGTDTHFNFQLARHASQGLTAGYVGWTGGKITSYRPGSFSEFEVGSYDFEKGQQWFRVRLQLQLDADLCRLTIQSVNDEQTLVDGVPVALNGWNPVGDSTKAITFDARTGSVVVIDEIRISGPKQQTLFEADFEQPTHTNGADVVGTAGWVASSFCKAPARSRVSKTAADNQLRELTEELEAASRAAGVRDLRINAARALRQAAEADLASVRARVEADRATYLREKSPDQDQLVQLAAQREREARLARAEATVTNGEAKLAEAESMPMDDKGRQKAIATAKKELDTARAASSKVRGTLEQESSSTPYTRFSPIYPKTSSGRRRALATWITSRQNPLTARVAVNHIWMRHFHEPLVETVNDFGRNGKPPTHPRLLDWLAVELMESDWSMKKLHRLIVTSAAYRRKSADRSAQQQRKLDPENHFLWRMNAGRMEAEVVRDSLLYCGSALDEKMGGQELENSESLTNYRRSIYFSVHPELGGKSAIGELFDGPDALECYRRTRTIVPQQALALTNSELVHQMSASLVQAWEQQNVSDDEQSARPTNAFIASAFVRILGRDPTAEEIKLCVHAYNDQLELAKSAENPERVARESIVRALFNHNDFVTIR